MTTSDMPENKTCQEDIGTASKQGLSVRYRIYQQTIPVRKISGMPTNKTCHECIRNANKLGHHLFLYARHIQLSACAIWGCLNSVSEFLILSTDSDLWPKPGLFTVQYAIYMLITVSFH